MGVLISFHIVSIFSRELFLNLPDWLLDSKIFSGILGMKILHRFHV
jgi:hypothetical protein